MFLYPGDPALLFPVIIGTDYFVLQTALGMSQSFLIPAIIFIPGGAVTIAVHIQAVRLIIQSDHSPIYSAFILSLIFF